MKKLILLILISIGLNNVLSAQDECNTAVNLPFTMHSTCGEMAISSIDLSTATPSTTAPAPACANFTSGTTNDLWYSITVPAGVNSLAFHMFNSSHTVPFPNTSQPGMAIYGGLDCSNLVLLDCFTSTGGMLQNGEIRFEEVNGLTPGATYYMRVWDENNLAQDIFVAASVRLDFDEDYCDSPAALTTGGCNILSTGDDIQAPETCGWNTTDNSIFYHFTVTASDPQPYSITATNGTCMSNPGGMTNPELQFAVYSWNGVDCTGIGGSPSSTPANNTGSYWGCANGTGNVTFSANLPPGDYVLAFDGYSMLAGNSLCTYGFSAPFIEEVLDVDLTVTNAICGQTGSANITVNQSCSGAPSYLWSTGDSTSGISNLTAGAYSVTVSDTGSCADTIINFNVADTGSITADATVSGDICSGPFEATAQVSGASPDLCMYQWNTSPQQITQTATNLTPGNYIVTVTFGTCQDTAMVNVDYSNVSPNLSYDSGFCSGESGQATVNPTGTPPFAISWSTGDSTNSIDITSSGNYSVSVIDSYGCMESESFNVDIYPGLDLSANVTDNQCYGSIIAEVDAEVMGGTPPFDYNWNSGQITEDISNLNEGGYALTVTDDNGCSAVNSWIISEPDSLYFSFTGGDSLCRGESATLNINAQGGTPPYSYNWGGLSVNAQQLVVTPDSTSYYTVNVTDANGCTSSSQNQQLRVSQPMSLDLSIEDCNCYNSCDGEASVVVSGGVPSYSYEWSSGSSSNYDIEDLCAGSYGLTIEDRFGCRDSLTFDIDQPNQITQQIYTEPATCSYTQDGLAWIDVQGGTPPYNYNWSGDTTLNNDSVVVGGGPHYITVTDANGCYRELETSVYAPEPIIIQGISNRNICINGGVQFNAVASGGSGDYDFKYINEGDTIWYNPSFSVDSLEEDTDYTIKVTDTEGCTASRNFRVSVYPELMIENFFADKDTICKGDPVNLYTEISGGNGGPYNVYLSDKGIIPSPYTTYPQESGYYHIRVDDECTTPPQKDSLYIHVWELPKNNFEADVVDGCPPLEVNFTEAYGDDEADYEWNFGDGAYSYEQNPRHIYRKSGWHDVSLAITDENGCENVREKNQMIRVYNTPEIDFYYEPNNISMLNPLVSFYSVTSHTDSLYWYFGDGDSTTNSTMDVTHYYYGIGEYQVKAIGENVAGCKDTIRKVLNINEEYSFYAPTAFTPNNDGENDCFAVCGHGIDRNEFILRVYDRWGELVFETKEFDPASGCNTCADGSWDGTKQGNYTKGDKLLSPGLYSWVCVFKDKSGIVHEHSGEVSLIR